MKYSDDFNKIIQGDCLEKLKDLPDNSVDAIVTDPPYELGFMGKKWDNTGIAYNVELWKECLRVLKSGGHLLAFGGTRTYHRMAVAIEDAGFEVRDMLEWIYFSGFPKSQNIGKVYDKKMGNEREVVGYHKAQGTNKIGAGGYAGGIAKLTQKQEAIEGWDKTKGNSEWEGFGTALKPAHEPIILARKSLSEKTIVENVLKHGTGALDIDGCRIPTSDTKELYRKPTEYKDIAPNAGMNASKVRGSVNDDYLQGRFPANIICTDDALNDGVMTKSVQGKNVKRQELPNVAMSGKNYARFNAVEGHNDSGSKSRYFDIDVWAEKHGLLQFPKASKSERNAGMEGYVLKSGVSDETVKEIKNLLSI